MIRHVLVAAACVIATTVSPTTAEQQTCRKLDPELSKLVREYEQALSDWARAPRNPAKPAHGQSPVVPPNPLDVYAPKFKAFADDHAGTPLAIDSIRCLLGATNQLHTQGKLNAHAEWAIETLTRDYAMFPEVIDTLGNANPQYQQIRRSLGIRFLNTVIDSNKDPEAVAMAKLQLGQILWKPDRSNQAEHDTPENRAAGIALIRDVALKYPETRAGKSAARDVKEIDSLQVGMAAPDFDATDVNGRAVRFSDLRGRVVVLIFWGAFASAEGDRIPIPSEVAAEYADKPVTFLGISSDTDVEKTRATLLNEGVNWTTIVDGASGGTIATLWNIRGWPTILIVDQRGAIRQKKVSPDQLRHAIDQLLAEK